MHATPVTSHAAPQAACVHRPAGAPAAVSAPLLLVTAGDANDDASFVGLLNAYRHSGGLARAVEVSRMFACLRGTDERPRAPWLARRCWIAFEWQAQTWLPRFQFLPAGPLPMPAVAAVLDELNPVFDAWEIAEWFARRNACLGGHAPVDALGEDPCAVLQAARFDRYVATG